MTRPSQQINKETNFPTHNQNADHVIKSDLIEINTPIFPDSIEDGTIATWHVEVGDKVGRDQVLCDIETDKVVLEVVAPSDGVLYAVIKDEGEIVLSQAKIAVLEVKNQFIRTEDDQNSSPKNFGDLIRAQMNN